MSGGKKGLLERLAEGPVIGDGSMVFILEKRGYIQGGPYTPEAVLEYPDAVRALSGDYLRAGSDVIQSCTFFSSEDQLKWRAGTKNMNCASLNSQALDIAHEVASRGDALVCGGISPTQSYAERKGKAAVQEELRRQVKVFIEKKADFLLGEFFAFVEEAEWAIEVMKESGLPVGLTMRIGYTGDMSDVSPEECAVRMAKAGVDLLGLNCQYDPTSCITVIKQMKRGLDEAGLNPYLMLQPVCFHCPEVVNLKMGYHELPEFPFALEPRLLTRWEVRKYAREAYEAGVRYLGGCCGFEPYHIREMAEELAEERGKRPPGSDKNLPYGGGMAEAMSPYLRVRCGRDYWMNIVPSTGRPLSAAHAVPDPTAPQQNTYHDQPKK